jgi:type II secretory pathway component GspD/PulD (secretin)/outer membrane protein assembly factor BamD (BamD/ComL family)
VSSSSRGVPSSSLAGKLALLSAVVLATQAGLISWVHTAAADNAPVSIGAATATSNGELFREGLEQYNAAQYQQAMATLSSVDAQSLSPDDQAKLTSTLAAARDAVRQWQFARNELALGDQALTSQNASAAITHYKKVLSNRFADSDTVHRAYDQLAVAEHANPAPAATDPQTILYEQATDDLHSGRYDAARVKLQQLLDAGYIAPSFDQSPRQMLIELEMRTGAPSFPGEVAAPPVPTVAAPPAPNPAAVAEPTYANPQDKLYFQALDDMRTACYDAARDELRQLLAAGYSAPSDQRTPQDLLSEIERRTGVPSLPVEGPAHVDPERAIYDQAVADIQAGRKTAAEDKLSQLVASQYTPPAPNPTPKQLLASLEGPAVIPPAAVTPPAVVAPAPVASQVNPDDAIYFQALRDVRDGSYDTARSEFQRLLADNYSPPIFHRTPKEMLVEIEARTGQPSFPGEAPAPALTPAPIALAQVSNGSPSSPTSAAGAPAAQNPPPSVPVPSAPGGSPPAAPPVPPHAESPAQPNSTPAVVVAPPSAPAPTEADIQQQAQFRARGLVDLARKAYAGGDKHEALRDYSLAVDLDPSNADAQEGKAQVSAELNAAPAPAASQLRSEIEVEIQDIEFRFGTAIRDTRAAIGSDDFATAERRLEDARVARNIDPGIFPVEQIHEMDTTIGQVDQQLKDEKQAYDLRTAEATQKEVEQEQEARAQQQREERDRTVTNLIHLCRQDIDANNYAGALGVLDQIQVLDPNNDYATGVRDFVEDRAVLQDQAHYRELFDRNYSKILVSAEEKQIPYDDIIRYPDNWPDISEERDAEVQEERGISRQDQATEALLDKQLPEMSFEGTTLTDAIDYFHDITGANILLDTKALEAAGVDRSTPITVKLKDVKFSKALDIVLKLAGGTTPLGYDIDENVITISTQDELSKKTTLAVYDVRDLLVQIPQFMQQDLSGLVSSISASGGQSTQLGGGNTGAANLSSGSGGNALSSGSSGSQTGQQNSQAALDALIKLITDTVAPDTWRNAAGGTIGSIEPLLGTGQVVVTQTADNQQKIQDLLDKIREKRDIMITVEVRFLTVTRDFLDNVGLNLSATFNLNRGANSVFSTVPVTNIASTNLTSAPSVAGAAVDLAGLTTPTSIAFTYLDDFEVNFMLQAVEASENTSLVNAPKVTVFNGGSALLVNATSVQYISSLTPILAAGAVGFEPAVSTAFGGVTLFVSQAVVTADRKYVTLQLLPTLQSPPQLQSFTFATGVTSTGGIGGVTNGTFNETVQLLTQNVTSVETVVTVPDGGTLLLGGQTIAGETEVEQGLPVLSKVPFLKRLFTNESMAKDEQVVFILVKPTILIQHEQEDKAFPLLNNQPSGE